MSDHPILFRGEMVRAILDGRKTMTRRVLTPPAPWDYGDDGIDIQWAVGNIRCPYGKPGDRLWVRETWRVGTWDETAGMICVDYKADGHARKEWLQVKDEEQFERLWVQSTDDVLAAGLETGENDEYHWEPGKGPTRWRPSIFMPRWAARLTPEVVSVRAERVQDISDEDIVKEGVGRYTFACGAASDNPPDHRWAFIKLWDSINAKRGHGWHVNDWVWVVEFGMLP